MREEIVFVLGARIGTRKRLWSGHSVHEVSKGSGGGLPGAVGDGVKRVGAEQVRARAALLLRCGRRGGVSKRCGGFAGLVFVVEGDAVGVDGVGGGVGRKGEISAGGDADELVRWEAGDELRLRELHGGEDGQASVEG